MYEMLEEYKNFKRIIKRRIKKIFPTFSKYLFSVTSFCIYNNGNTVVDFRGVFDIHVNYKNTRLIVQIEFNKTFDTFYIQNNSIVFRLEAPYADRTALKDFYMDQAELTEVKTFMKNHNAKTGMYSMTLEDMHKFVSFFRRTILLKKQFLEL